ncbi:transglutaminase-like cysteine peptidase [Aminobacter sp. AP02]|uniref:transglutaminase-like cysteine peptidase n=1 Tax=Aminobacter sp. AP02 TaxID=2135737 RepID=UPI000D6B772C|nr:transglutaminase-like cysteine peptidase [Aminobacter sp. AP02]PWK76752.1 putative transglutaminase-like cysteine proteinase [Aminobacter sp. AP02]
MKATVSNVSKFGLKTFAAALTLFAVLDGATASERIETAATHASQAPAPQLLGGLMLVEAKTATAELKPFQFGGDFDGYALALRSTSEDLATATPGIDTMKTAAIIPGVFGSVAIPMRNFPVAGRWAKVYSQISDCADADACGKNGAILSGLAVSSRDGKFLDKLVSVNRAVNTMIAYRKDEVVYGNLDYWAKPAEILSRGAGDCEDFAILKMAALIEAGVPAQSMSLVVLQDRSRGVFHAVLSVATQSGTFILDNLSNGVLRDGDLKSYIPLYSFSTDRAWIHGAKSGSEQIATASGGFSAIAPGEGPLPQ